MRIRALLLAASALLLFLVLMPGRASAESRRAWSFKPDKGFVDEPMAFSADGSRFAFLHTDAAEFLNLIVLRTEGFKKEIELKLDDPTWVPRSLVFTPDGGRLVVVWTDGRSGAQGAALYDLKAARLLKKLGPATAAAVAACGDQQCLALTRVRSAGGSTVHAVNAYRTADFKPLGAGSATVQPDQTMKIPPLRLLYFEPGNLSLMGMQKGKYDKKRDIRLPERAVRWSLLARKELWAEEPKELLEWTRAVNMRPSHPGQARFVQVSDDLKDLLLCDRENKLTRLSLPVRWVLYEPKSLVQAESWDGKTLFFSLSIDPVNREAVKRKKADKERVDLYLLGEGSTVRPLGQVYTGKRGFRWSAGSRYFAYLRKLKGFGRGGNEVELYPAGL